MTGLQPRIFQKDNDRIVIRSSMVPRILFGLFAAFLLSGMIGAHAFSAPLIVVFAIAVFSALYTDRWIFDRSSRNAEYHLGFPVLHYTRVVPFDAIDRIEYSETTRSRLFHGRDRRSGRSADHQVPEDPTKRWRMQTHYTQLGLVTSDGKHHAVGITSLEVVGDSGKAAETIASFCKKPLVEAP